MILIILLTVNIVSNAQFTKFDQNQNEEQTDNQEENEYDKPKDVPVDSNITFLVIISLFLGVTTLKKTQNLLKNDRKNYKKIYAY